MSLKNRAFRAMFWIAFASYTAKGISYLSQVILARLMAPDVFGLVAIVSIVLSSFTLLREMGLNKTLIARKDNPPNVLNTAFYVSVAAGVALFIVALLAASPIAAAFNEPTVASLIRFLSVQLVINAFSAVPSAILEKDLGFKKLAWPKLFGALTSALLSISLAMAGFGVWSLAWSSLISSIVNAVSVWVVCGWRPAWSFDRKAFSELFSFSKHVLGMSWAVFLQRNVDTVMVGKVLGMTQAAYYNLAFELANGLPFQLITPISPVILPTYSQVQHEPERLAQLHLRLNKYLLLGVGFLTFSVALLAEDIIRTVYGDKWAPVVLPLRILCVYAFIRNVATMNAPVLMVTDRVKQLSLAIYLSLAVLVIFSYPVLRLGGLTGMSMLMIVVTSTSAAMTYSASTRVLRTPVIRYLQLLLTPIIASITSALFFHLLVLLAPTLNVTDYGSERFLMNLAVLSAKGIFVAGSYTCTAYATDGRVRADLNMYLSQLVKRISGRIRRPG